MLIKNSQSCKKHKKKQIRKSDGKIDKESKIVDKKFISSDNLKLSKLFTYPLPYYHQYLGF